MVIRGVLVGTCIVNDLRDLRVNGGQFYDLKDLFDKEEIVRSLKPPKGSLYIAISQKLVEIIRTNSFEYKQWQERLSTAEREIARKKNRRDPSHEMMEYWELDIRHRRAYIQGLTANDCVVLEKIRDKENDEKLQDMILDKLMFFSDVQFPSGFVPL